MRKRYHYGDVQFGRVREGRLCPLGRSDGTGFHGESKTPVPEGKDIHLYW